MPRTPAVAACSLVALLVCPPSASAQVDITVFVGKAFPTYDERLTLSPAIPALPGVDVTAVQSPLLRADGGPVFGAALAFEAGIFAIEGRLDSTEVGLEFTGAEYELRGTQPPLRGFTAPLVASPGRFDADRINIVSVNARLRTPGPVGIVASGGLSYLPDIRVGGSIPFRLDIPGVPSPFGTINAALNLRATPGESGKRFGVNAGAGVRFGGRVGVMAEARAFYFKEYELRLETGEEVFDDLLRGLDPVRFTPVFVNVQAGLVFRF